MQGNTDMTEPSLNVIDVKHLRKSFAKTVAVYDFSTTVKKRGNHRIFRTQWQRQNNGYSNAVWIASPRGR